ncbi:ABC transporter substrate-binding protein [Micromonospora sp. NPDC048830]|uniref:ABC transporter substrate-binding protein n=1 Tax=Micromonospora sp. NPDC048830 TaxID=3364257 RepID=UPI00371CC6B8
MNRRGGLRLAAVGAALVMMLTACGSDSGDGTASDSKSDDAAVQVTLALAVQSGCPFCISIQRGAESAAKDLGVDLTVVSPKTADTAGQIQQLNGLLANNPDVLVLQPFDPAALLPVVKHFADKGTPTITVDSDLSDPSARLGLISSDNEAGGKFAAEQLAERIGEKGKVLYLGYKPGLAGTDARRKGFEEQIKTYPSIEYLGAQYSADDQSVTAGQVSAALRANPDLAGIFAGAEAHAIGAAAAIREAHAQDRVSVVAFDGAPDEVQALKDNSLDLLVVQKAYEMGQLAIKQAVAYAKDGTKPDGDTYPDYVAVTRDNLAEADVRKYLYPAE